MDAADHSISRLAIAITTTPKGGGSLPSFRVEPPPQSAGERGKEEEEEMEKNQQPNFMHDPCTVLVDEPTTTSKQPYFGVGGNSNINSRSSSSNHSSIAGCNQQQLEQQQQQQQQQMLLLGGPETRQRKASLMPPLTEEDLRTTGMGHRDPESVAQLFGQDFASRFCLGPLLLPHEIRDCSVPRGVPTVKMRRRSNTENALSDPATTTTTLMGTDNAGTESIVPLTPVVPKYPSLPSCSPSSSSPPYPHPFPNNNNNNKQPIPMLLPSHHLPPPPPLSATSPGRVSPQGWLPTFASSAYLVPGVVLPRPIPFPVQFRWNVNGQIQMVPFQRPGPGEFYHNYLDDEKDMAASHPDLFKFQLALDGWIKRQCKTRGSALLLSSLEMNSTFCQVCGGRLLDQSIQLGDADFLSNLLNNSNDDAVVTADMVTGEEERRRRRNGIGGHGVGLDEVEVICDDEEMVRINSSSSREGNYYNNDEGGGSGNDAKRGEEEDGGGGGQAMLCRAVDTLDESVRHALSPLLALFDHHHHPLPPPPTDQQQQQQELSSIPLPPLSSSCFSMVGLRSNSGFTAGLLLAHQSESSRQEELELLSPHVGMLSTLMTLMHNIEEQRRLAQQSQVFLSMTQNVFSSLQDMNQLVRNITKEAKALVQAEICSLFLLDKEHAELVAEVFEKNGTSEEYLTEIRMPLSQGIVGHVASTGLMMNVKDVYNHPFFYPKVDERTGFKTRNILCFPIKDSASNLVGVAELCNKIGRDAFTRHDEQIAATFSVYCAISLSHCLLYRKLQEAHRRSHMAAELLVQGSTLSIAPEDILRLTVRDIPPPRSFHPEFDQLQFIPRSIGYGDIYVEASLAMFKELGFIDRFRLRRRTLARFLLMVQKGYRDVPYHNWGHAFAVAHFCYLLLRLPMVQTALNELERFALLVASLCHDIDHRGTTNAFQLQSKTPLAQLYSSEGSVLERHHFAQTVTILGMDECNIFEQLNRQQYVEVLDCIREIILATDIAAHLRKVDRIRQMAEGGFKPGHAEHRYLFMCLLMTASDLSDQSKDFRHSKAIAENIYKEFFSQGDLEKQMGNRPIEMMDRERACVPKIQIEFMDTVALPVFKYLANLLPELRCTQCAILRNRRCWLALDKILQEQGLPTGGLDYLRNAGLEENVMLRVEPPETGEEEEEANANDDDGANNNNNAGGKSGGGQMRRADNGEKGKGQAGV